MQLLGIGSWIHPSRSLLTWSFFCTHFFSLSLTPFFAPTPIAFNNLNSNNTVFLFAKNLANHFLSAWSCQLILFFSKSLISLLSFVLHLRHYVTRCSTHYTISLHHQQSGVFITLTLFRYVSTAPCLSLSW